MFVHAHTHAFNTPTSTRSHKHTRTYTHTYTDRLGEGAFGIIGSIYVLTHVWTCVSVRG